MVAVRPSVVFAVGGIAIIVASIVLSPNPTAWLLRVTGRDLWLEVLAWVVLPALALIVVAWLTRLAFVLTRASLTLRRMPTAIWLPERLADAMARTRAGRVRCISGSVPIAFCAGVLSPEIVVSEGLSDRLDDHELDAVLLHEREHLREREPVVRAASEAAALVLFFCPLARWWSRRRIELAELRADRAAVREVGPRPVAAALCTLGSALPSQAAFAGAAEVRVAQLLGDPLPRRRPSASTVVTSLLGFPFAIAVAGCAIQTLLQMGGH
jgi:Zn-dependent protease with chaperone function